MATRGGAPSSPISVSDSWGSPSHVYGREATVVGSPLSGSPFDAIGQPLNADDAHDASSGSPHTSPTARARTTITSALDGTRGVWFSAARSGDVGTLKLILEKKSMAIDAKGDWGMTALHFAVKGRQRGAVDLLLRHGANPNVIDRGLDNDTPLHVAAYTGCVEIVRLLLKYGANIDAVNQNGRNPAFLAFQNGGGMRIQKEETYAVLTGWKSAVVGVPVLVRPGVAETSDTWYFNQQTDEQYEQTHGQRPGSSEYLGRPDTDYGMHDA